MIHNFIYPFSQTATLETVGGKGLNLMRLTQAGMPVPSGFVVSTASYAAFVTFNHLDEKLEAAFAALEAGQPLREISAQIRTACGGSSRS